ncbi:hypothetical protein QT972_01030 [Microcoleus sp. herbarium7]|uniref:hypothetical protein n=1 Tax=Microcoleus sp. herbarium7 TaxID=3055435 RepID=UPI002FD121DC
MGHGWYAIAKYDRTDALLPQHSDCRSICVAEEGSSAADGRKKEEGRRNIEY